MKKLYPVLLVWIVLTMGWSGCMNPRVPASSIQPPPVRAPATLSDDEQVVYPAAAPSPRRSVFGAAPEPTPARVRASEAQVSGPPSVPVRDDRATAAAAPRARPQNVSEAGAAEPRRDRGDEMDIYMDLPGYRLRAGDPVIIELRGIPVPEKFELKVDERGYISLPFIEPLEAAGKSSSELQRDIQRSYIENQIYRQITPIVVIPAQSYFIRGEVRQPGRYPVITGLKLLQAVAAAGGYTEFANPRRISIIRDEKTRDYNARDFERFPTRDIDIQPGDVIVVPRSVW